MEWNSRKQSEFYLERLVAKGGLVSRLPSGELVGRMAAKEVVRPNRKSPWQFKVNPETNCWEWLRARSPGGYALGVGKGMNLGHRLYYTFLALGIPGKLELDHLCRTPPCVNPSHLEPVTSAENTRRGIRLKLNLADVREIKRLWESREKTQIEISKLYGVHKDHVCRVISGAKWGGV